MAAIDPMAVLAKSTVALKAIFSLPGVVTNALSSTDQHENYEKKCRKNMVDLTLAPAIVDKNCES